MMKRLDRLNTIKRDLEDCSSVLNAICDLNRQKILIVLLENCSTGGVRVGDIADRVSLSRPAVSHHLKVLLDNGIVTIDHIGTKNYYHITGVDKILSLKSLFQNIELYINEEEL